MLFFLFQAVPWNAAFVYNKVNATPRVVRERRRFSMIQFGLRLHDAEKLPVEQVLPLVPCSL